MQASIDQVFEQLGGKDAIGVKVRSESEMERQLREGFTVSVLQEFSRKLGLHRYGIGGQPCHPKEHTDAHAGTSQPYGSGRFRSGLSFSLNFGPGGSERSVTVRRHSVGSDKANEVLGNQTPLRALETEIGVRRVEQILGRIAYGGVS